MPRRHVRFTLREMSLNLFLLNVIAVRKAVLGMMAMKRMSLLAHHTPEHRALEHDLFKYKEESEKVRLDSIVCFYIVCL